jgi:hypothetical protein
MRICEKQKTHTHGLRFSFGPRMQEWLGDDSRCDKRTSDKKTEPTVETKHRMREAALILVGNRMLIWSDAAAPSFSRSIATEA